MELSDDEFACAFERCALDEFHHADHVRLAWIYLQSGSYHDAERRIVDGIRRFAASKGATEKYHETMTRAWLRLIAAATNAAAGQSFQQMVASHPELLDQRTLDRFYSRERLMSAAARSRWVDPDIHPLPECAFD